MSEKNEKPPEELQEPPEELQEPPLAHRKIHVVGVAALLAGFFFYDVGVTKLGWTPFLSVGLAINAGGVYAVLLYVYPLVAIGVSLFLLLAAIFFGDIGYWLSGISVIVYFLTAFRSKKKAEEEA